MLLWSLQKSPEQEILHPMTEIIRGKRPKVGIVSSRAGSVGPLADWLGRRFIVEVCDGVSFSKVCSLAESCGMCIFYGCDESLIRAAHQNKNCRKVFVLRSEDIYGDQIEYVGFGQSDEIVVAGPQTAVDTLKERAKLSGPAPRVVRADEAVDFQRCVFTSRSRGKRLAAMGPFDAESNVMFLLQCIQKLHYIDRDFRLYLAGGFTGRAVEEYVRGMIGSLGLEGAVFLDGPVANEVLWLKDKHYFVSADIGGAGMGHIWSAMACGLRPVVHRFPGADDMLDAEFLFNISEEFCVQVQSCGYEPLRYRRFVEQRRKQYGQFKAVNDALLRLERQMILSDSSVGGDDEKQRVDSKLSSVSREVAGNRPAALPWERSDLSSVCGRENN
jgi:glycosyltransferase involved in cell wall biosynthesis